MSYGCPLPVTVWLEPAAEQSDVRRLIWRGSVGRRRRRPGITWRWTLGLWRTLLQHLTGNSNTPVSLPCRDVDQPTCSTYCETRSGDSLFTMSRGDSNSTTRRTIAAHSWFLTLQVWVGNQTVESSRNNIGTMACVSYQRTAASY